MAEIVIVGSQYKCNQNPILKIMQGNLEVASSGLQVVDDNCLQFTPFSPGIPCMCLTSKAAGTPMPCIPIILSWSCSNKTVKISGKTIVTQACKAKCSHGGELSFLFGPESKVFAE